MAWYRSGTVSLTNGSTTVTGSGTAFIANASIGEAFLGPDGRSYEITDIPSNTSLTISPAYLGSTASGQSYAILPARGRIADLIAETQSLLGSFATVRDGIGAGLFPDGSAATPAFRFTNDQDTGFYRAGNNTIGISTSGAARAFWSENGSLWLRPTTSAVESLVMSVGAAASGAASAFDILTSDVSSVALLRLRQTRYTGSVLVTHSSDSGERKSIEVFNTPASHEIALFGPEADNTIKTLISGTAKSYFGFTVEPLTDNNLPLGASSKRWSVLYAGTGTINTSDEREKHWRGELSSAELRAAKRIIGELGIYQWNDAVAEKGEDDARLHFGVRAQRAFAIMEDEGLDWARYAWACYDQWEEQTEPVIAEVTVTKTRQVMRPSTLIDPITGQPAMVLVNEPYEEAEMQPTGETRVTLEAGDRYGVRPDQLAFWLIAAQAAIQADLEARLAILETA